MRVDNLVDAHLASSNATKHCLTGLSAMPDSVLHGKIVRMVDCQQKETYRETNS